MIVIVMIVDKALIRFCLHKTIIILDKRSRA